jgi:hypothetical protein
VRRRFARRPACPKSILTQGALPQPHPEESGFLRGQTRPRYRRLHSKNTSMQKFFIFSIDATHTFPYIFYIFKILLRYIGQYLTIGNKAFR